MCLNPIHNVAVFGQSRQLHHLRLVAVRGCQEYPNGLIVFASRLVVAFQDHDLEVTSEIDIDVDAQMGAIALRLEELEK